MNASLPKQFLEINGIPIFFYTISAFLCYDPSIHIIVTLPETHIDFWSQLIDKHRFNFPHTLVCGGETRFQSIKNALKQIPDNSLVAIHDAVRPFLSKEVIHQGFKLAEAKKSAIPVMEATDSIRRITPNENRALNRSEIYLVQTPQVFNSARIIEAYSVHEQPSFTDDASVYESKYDHIDTFSGNRENIKITTPFDLIFADLILKSLTNNPSFPQIGSFKGQ